MRSAADYEGLRNFGLAGRDPFHDFDWFRGTIAVVLQSDHLLPWRTALANVAYGLELNQVEESERLAIARPASSSPIRSTKR